MPFCRGFPGICEACSELLRHFFKQVNQRKTQSTPAASCLGLVAGGETPRSFRKITSIMPWISFPLSFHLRLEPLRWTEELRLGLCYPSASQVLMLCKVFWCQRCYHAATVLCQLVIAKKSKLFWEFFNFFSIFFVLWFYCLVRQF